MSQRPRFKKKKRKILVEMFTKNKYFIIEHSRFLNVHPFNSLKNIWLGTSRTDRLFDLTNPLTNPILRYIYMCPTDGNIVENGRMNCLTRNIISSKNVIGQWFRFLGDRYA